MSTDGRALLCLHKVTTTEETTMSDERCEPCIGGDYCGCTTNGYFGDGTHGPGWYCGWCAAVPHAS